MNKVMQIHLNRLRFETMHSFYTYSQMNPTIHLSRYYTLKKCNAQTFRLLYLILGTGLMWVPPGTQKYDFL